MRCDYLAQTRVFILRTADTGTLFMRTVQTLNSFLDCNLYRIAFYTEEKDGCEMLPKKKKKKRRNPLV